MRVLVAGATGHLGRELVPLLAGREIHVRILTRNADRARQQFGDVPEYVTGDARDPRSLAGALTGVDAVASAMTGFGPGGAGPRAIDLEGNLNLIRAAEKADVSRFVFVSMHGAAAHHPMELGRMKYQIEALLQSSRIDWAIVRPMPFMELWLGIIGDPIAKGGTSTVFGHGDNPINFNSARDVARFVEVALINPQLSRVALDIGGPENVSLNDLVQRIAIALDRKAAVRHVPVSAMRVSRLLVRPFRPDIAGLIQGGIAFDTADMSFDAGDLRRRFPQIALTSLAQIIGSRFGATEARPAAGLVRGGLQS